MDNNLTFWGNGTENDIKLSMEDYFDLVDCVQDERLSREGLMKFKNLHEVNIFGISTLTFRSCLDAYLLFTYWCGSRSCFHW